MANHPTKPVETDRMPPGIPYIIGNEAAERFCYYGLSAILTVFMATKLTDRSGTLDTMTAEQAKASFHMFTFAAYFMPVFGAILADVFWGKFRTILILSMVYCLGSFALAADQNRIGLLVGLILIAIGTGGIKPCVSANVGDQFGEKNKHLLPRAFSWFYFSINFGSFFSTILTPWLLEKYGARIAFGIPGIFMALATLVFYLGRNKFVRVPPTGKKFLTDVFCRDGVTFLLRLTPVYLAVAVFWSLWNQTMSAWVLQADKMDRHMFGIKVLPAQVQAANPILILLLIPVCTYLLYPAIDKVFKLTPLRKIGIGFFLTVPSFLLPAWIEAQITAGQHPHMAWQFAAYIIISLAEIMVSVTCLEFSYTQAPKNMKSFIMSFYLLSIAAGNFLASGINYLIQVPEKPGIEPSHLVDPADMAARLEQSADSIAKFTWEKVTPATRKILADPNAGVEPQQAALASDLNAAITAGAIYTPERFAGVKLTASLTNQLSRSLQGDDLVRLNRALLEAAYPGHLSRNGLLLSAAGMTNAASLAAQLRQQATPVHRHFWNLLSPTARAALSGANSQQARSLLIQEFNRLIAGPSLYDATNFAQVALSWEARDLLEDKPDGEKLAHLNRLLIDQAFPAEIARYRDTRVTSKLPGASYFVFFSGMMALTSVLFIFIALTYKERQPDPAEAAKTA